jgi:hypothetical protein
MRRDTGIFLAVLLFSGIGHAQTTVTRAQYQSIMHDLRHAAEHKIPPSAAATLKQHLAQAKVVRLPDGMTVAPDNSAVLQELDTLSHSTNPKKLKAPVEQQILVLDSLLRSTDMLKVDVKTTLDSILRQKEFQTEASADTKNTWFEELQKKILKVWSDIGRWFLGILRRLFGGRVQPGSGGLWFIRLIQGLLIVFVLVVIGVALYYLIRWAFSVAPTLRKRNRVTTGLDLLEPGLTDPLGAAQELAAKGDYRGALRLAYIACLRQLATVGLLIMQENKTNWEYQRDLLHRSMVAYEELMPATRLFDFVWYGQRNATLEEYTEVLAAHEAIRNIQMDASSNLVASPQKEPRKPK